MKRHDKGIVEILLPSDHLFKIVMVGNAGSGKSSLLLRFADNAFNESYMTTIGVDFDFRSGRENNKASDCSSLLIQWDTAGQERFRTITSAYYRNADGVILVYDCTSQQTFDDIDRYWIQEAEKNAEKSTKLMILGNKADLKDDKIVDEDMVKKYCDHRSME